jgi:hypothetical protein
MLLIIDDRVDIRSIPTPNFLDRTNLKSNLLTYFSTSALSVDIAAFVNVLMRKARDEIVLC